MIPADPEVPALEPVDQSAEPSPTTDTEPVAPRVGASILAGLEDRLGRLEARFENKIVEDEQHRQWVARLTSELKDYREDFVYRYVTSKVFRDLIQLFDTVDQTLRAAETGTVATEALIPRLRSIRAQLLQSLTRQDVVAIQSAAGTPFDEGIQEAIDVRAVDRHEEDGTVVEVARPGFRYGERLLRPEAVVVGRFETRNGGASDE